MIEQIRSHWRPVLGFGAAVACLLAAIGLAFVGRWIAALMAAIAIVPFFELGRLYSALHTFTGLLSRRLAGEGNIHFPMHEPGIVGQFGRALNVLNEKYTRLRSKRSRERDRLTTLLMEISDGALLVNRNGEVRLINPAAARLLKMDANKVTRRSLAQVVWDHRIVEVWQRCQQSGQEESATIDLDVARAVRVVVTPFHSADTPGYLVILDDLSQFRRLERIRRDFVSNVSHELRTPLASLRALVDTLRDGALDDPPAAERFLGRVETEVDKMTQMVEELLQLSRIESGQAPLRLVATPVAHVIQPVVERMQAQTERAGLTLHSDLPADLPPVLIDLDRVQQVVLNLIHNAIKFTPSGGKITLSATRHADKVTVCVADTGVGISAEDLPRIFERFYKADRARSGGGTGLGLAIAKHIVLAHVGEIWAESNEGKGSRFYFSLPVAT